MLLTGCSHLLEGVTIEWIPGGIEELLEEGIAPDDD
jgi:hypothetical protein